MIAQQSYYMQCIMQSASKQQYMGCGYTIKYEDHIDRIIEIDKIGRFSIGFPNPLPIQLPLRPRVEGDWNGAAFHGVKEVIVRFHHISHLEFQSISSVSLQSRQSRSAAVLVILQRFDCTKWTGVVDLLPGAFLFAKPKSIVGFELPSMNYFFTEQAPLFYTSAQ